MKSPDKTTGVRDISMDEAQQRLWHASDTLNDDHRRRRSSSCTKSENVCPVWEEQQKWEERIRLVTHDANDRGRVKTPRPAARVEYLGVIARRESRIMLRPYGSIPCWRIVFSTFR